MAITIDGAGTITGLSATGISAQPVFAGQVLQVVSTTKTDVFSSTATTFTDITGMAATITPTLASSKILVLVSMVGGSNPFGSLVATRLVRGSTVIAVGDAASGYTQATVGNQRASLDNNSAFNLSINFLDSPATTSATTYKLQSFIESGTFRINTTGNDLASSIISARSASTITLMEIAG